MGCGIINYLGVVELIGYYYTISPLVMLLSLAADQDEFANYQIIVH